MKTEILAAILKEVAETSTQERKVFHRHKKEFDVSIGRVKNEGTKKLYNYSRELKQRLENLKQKALLIAKADNPGKFIKKLKEIAKSAADLYTKEAITDILLIESINEEFGINCLSKNQCDTIRIIDGWEVIKKNCCACMLEEGNMVTSGVSFILNSFSQN